ncbi:unnamed protein product, partial [Natator depressus]
EIIGGQEAKPHSRPFMAWLDIQRRNKHYRCRGFLVVENFVLTAAHCNGDEITVTLGAHNIREWKQSQQTISMRHRIPHPQYNNETCNNDIMLLQGDSGGPLVCHGKAQGIVSYSRFGGSTPRVFTRVSKYVCCIKKILHTLKP